MITHFAELQLQTVSLVGVKQVYAERLGMPIIEDLSHSVALQVAPHITLKFVERYEPLSPAHFAFEVPYSTYHDSVAAIKEAGILITGEITWGDGVSLYFRDGDGNILEIYAHDYVKEDVLPTSHKLHTLYLREVGFPVERVADFRAWLKATLDMYSDDDDPQDDFSFSISGTAHAVVVAKTRPWLNIDMIALPPPMRVTFGTPDWVFMERVRERLTAIGGLIREASAEIEFRYDNYQLALRHTPHFPPDIPARLNLPLATPPRVR